MVWVNQAESSSQGQWPPPGWATSVAFGNSPANPATTLGGAATSSSPASSSTGVSKVTRAARLTGGS